jgi:hypothetical protein
VGFIQNHSNIPVPERASFFYKVINHEVTKDRLDMLCGLWQTVNMLKTKHPEIETAELIKKYKRGQSLWAIGNAFGITATAVMERLKKAGFARRPKFTKINTPLLRRAKCLLTRARQTSIARGLPFNITLSDVEIPKVCPIFGTPLVIGKRSDNTPSLDRIEPAKGYVKGNVWVISLRANRIKNDATVHELRQIANALENKIGEKNGLRS